MGKMTILNTSGTNDMDTSSDKSASHCPRCGCNLTSDGVGVESVSEGGGWQGASPVSLASGSYAYPGLVGVWSSPLVPFYTTSISRSAGSPELLADKESL